MAKTKNAERFRPQLMIVDGRNLLFRAADASRALSVEVDGVETPIGGVYGFLNVVSKLRRRYGSMVIVAWEGRDNFRYKLFPDYKRKTSVPPTEADQVFRAEMLSQEPILQRILSLLGMTQFNGVGGEADDVIGTIVTRLRQVGPMGIFSNDSDLRQLVRDRIDRGRLRPPSSVKCVVPGFKGKDVIIGEAEVLAKYGVKATLLPDFKALSGDGSDGIPGVPGVGPKTAAAMIQEYGSAHGVVRAAKRSEVAAWKFSPRFRKLIVEHADRIPLYLKLTTIVVDLPLERIPSERDVMRARREMARYKFRSLLEAGPFRDLSDACSWDGSTA